MGDRVDASITIGGEVKDLDALVDAIMVEGLGEDWMHQFSDAEELIEYVRGGGRFFCANESNPELPEVVSECLKQGLSFRRDWDGNYSWNAGCAIREPDGRDHEMGTTEHGGMLQFTVLQAERYGLAEMKRLEAWEPPPLVLP